MSRGVIRDPWLALPSRPMRPCRMCTTWIVKYELAFLRRFRRKIGRRIDLHLITANPLTSYILRISRRVARLACQR